MRSVVVSMSDVLLTWEGWRQLEIASAFIQDSAATCVAFRSLSYFTFAWVLTWLHGVGMGLTTFARACYPVARLLWVDIFCYSCTTIQFVTVVIVQVFLLEA